MIPGKIKVEPLEIKEIGSVKEVKKGIAKIAGFGSCINGQLIEFSSGLKGLVIGFNEEEVLGLILGEESSIALGEKVFAQQEILGVGTGEEVLGRVVGSLGEPYDGKGKVNPRTFSPIFREAPGVMDRIPITRPLHTGIKIIDTVIPIGKGQRELIIGDRVTGKTTIALDTILNQRDKDVICVYCWIGGGYSGLRRMVRTLKENHALDYTVVVAASASSSPAEQYLAPYVAATLGEYFMYRGRDVLVVFDDLTKHAWIWRELSLLLKRSPGREAYPGDIFYLHSQLMERAANLNPREGGGSMTFLPIVETQQGDVTGYIPSNLIAMTDGQIYLSTSLFHEGFRPAIDLTLSVSRIGSKVQCDAMKEVSSRLRLEYAQYLELLGLTRLKTRVSAEVAEKMKRGETLCSIFSQQPHQPICLEEEIILFYAFSRDILDILPRDSLARFMAGSYTYISTTKPEVIKELSGQKLLTKRIRKRLDEAFVEFFKEERIF